MDRGKISVGRRSMCPWILKDEEPQPEESGLGTGVRNIARTAARVGETLVNIPENIAKLGMGVANLGVSGSNYLRSKVGLPEEEPFKYPEPLEDIGGKITGFIGKALPAKYLESKGPGEKFSDEFFSDLTSLAVPVPGIGKAMGIKRALSVAGLGNLAGWASENVGASEGTKNTLKIGTMLAATMAGKGKLNATKKDLYKASDIAIKEGTRLGISPEIENQLNPVLDKFSKILKQAGEPGSERYKFIKDRVAGLKKNTNRSKLPIDELITLEHDLNNIKYSGSGIPETAKHFFNEEYNAVERMIAEYGKRNPTFKKTYSTAKDIHRGLTKASAVNEFLQKHVTPLRLGGATVALLLGTHAGLPHVTGEVGAGAIMGAAAMKYGVRGFEALKNSPSIRKYYADTIKSAAKNNIRAATKNAQKLDKAMEPYNNEISPETKWILKD